jgi:hypothetical protein
MAEKTDVFVSHHHSPEEDAFTARLVADLEAAGADVWVDYQGISSGSFIEKINDGLSNRQWLILVMTPAALGSPWVRDEVNAALHQVKIGRMRDVIPFVMTPCDEVLIPPLWAQLHRYNATRGYEVARDGLLRAFGISLPTATAASKSPTGVRPNSRDVDVVRLRTLEGLLSLSAQEFEDAVAVMLKANGYSGVVRQPTDQPGDLRCVHPNGQSRMTRRVRDGAENVTHSAEGQAR